MTLPHPCPAAQFTAAANALYGRPDHKHHLAADLHVTTEAVRLWETGGRAIPGPAVAAVNALTELKKIRELVGASTMLE